MTKKYISFVKSVSKVLLNIFSFNYQNWLKNILKVNKTSNFIQKKLLKICGLFDNFSWYKFKTQIEKWMPDAQTQGRVS